MTKSVAIYWRRENVRPRSNDELSKPDWIYSFTFLSLSGRTEYAFVRPSAIYYNLRSNQKLEKAQMHVSIGDIILIEIKMCHLPYFVLIFSHVSMSPPLFSLRAEVTRIMYKYEKLSYYATGIIPHVGGKIAASHISSKAQKQVFARSTFSC